MVIVASGELHLERCLRDLKDRFAVDVPFVVSKPLVDFRETLASLPDEERLAREGRAQTEERLRARRAEKERREEEKEKAKRERKRVVEGQLLGQRGEDEEGMRREKARKGRVLEETTGSKKEDEAEEAEAEAEAEAEEKKEEEEADGDFAEAGAIREESEEAAVGVEEEEEEEDDRRSDDVGVEEEEEEEDRRSDASSVSSVSASRSHEPASAAAAASAVSAALLSKSAHTPNRGCTFRMRAVPLPASVTALLASHNGLLKKLAGINSGKEDAASSDLGQEVRAASEREMREADDVAPTAQREAIASSFLPPLQHLVASLRAEFARAAPDEKWSPEDVDR